MSLDGPGMAVFENKLYCIHRSHGGGDDNLFWTRFDGGTWTPDAVFPSHRSGAGPAAVAYRDRNGTKDQLLVIHRGYGNRAAGTAGIDAEARIAADEITAATPDIP
ncbi:hypothetical protein OG948_55850 (plasmid) [Embleya sp. NBC_00888]|uniref:hypothetical protein n=1 Tax=Embleya sp. NBC_00888 TaxID=2975960 RepID=UPI003863EEC7|nr:hypothetical protein OG948_55850 [Embleya sp. NBC_00888]